jgi:hypothetical protein
MNPTASRFRLARLTAPFTVLFALAFLLFSSTDSVAKGKKGKSERAEKKKKAARVNEKALGELMGSFTFGMDKAKVIAVLADEIKERYKDQIQGTNDTYRQDELRRKRDQEVERIKESFIEFDDKRTGWDVSIIDDQFGHQTGESMMVYWENVDGKDQRRFFFFHEGKLYKMFIALNSGMLKDDQRNFAYFQNIMEERYGTGNIEYTKDKDGIEHPTAIAWKSKKHQLRAVDKLDFYGSFCLVVADPAVEKKVAALRAATKQPPKKNTVIEAVVNKKGEDDTPDLRENEKAVDNVIKQK